MSSPHVTASPSMMQELARSFPTDWTISGKRLVKSFPGRL
jgi:hypothetical protein